MNFRELEYFIAIAEQRHFGKAARVVNVSQPTLSMQFKKLEETLGGELIERLPNGAVLTPLGEEVLPIAQQILDLREVLKSRCGGKQGKGKLRLGVIPTISPYLLPKINRGLREHFSDRSISLTEGRTAELLGRVQEGSLDAAILSTPVAEKGIEEIEIFSEPFYLAVNKLHPLARRKKVPLDVLKEEKILLLEEGHCLRNQALSICSLPQSLSDTDLSATSMETLRSMVALGAGVTLMPKLAVRRGDNLSYIPFADAAPSRMVGVVYRSSFYDRALIDLLCSVIARVANREGLALVSTVGQQSSKPLREARTAAANTI